MLTLALETFAPALALVPAESSYAPATRGTSLVAATCAKPNVDATVTSPAEPKVPHGTNLKGTVSVIIVVTIASSGNVVHLSIRKSSGNEQIDRAVAVAAQHSTYSPKLLNCKPIEGTYLFRADFQPNH
jgi:TonB family protein